MTADSKQSAVRASDDRVSGSGLSTRVRATALWSGLAGLGVLDLLALDDLFTNPAGGGPLELALIVASVPAVVTLIGLLRRKPDPDHPAE